MVEALAHHLKASLLVLDSCALAPHVSDSILNLVLLCNALDLLVRVLPFTMHSIYLSMLGTSMQFQLIEVSGCKF
jgi:hypothetical protein